jgi:GGDEF domain-containing protein
LRTEALFELAETLRRRVAGRSFLVLDKRVRVTISIGAVPAASMPMRSVDEMVEAGHLAVLRAKAAGGNRVELPGQPDDVSGLP